jgi:hypothetical protein
LKGSETGVLREKKVEKFMPYSPWNNVIDKVVARKRVRR